MSLNGRSGELPNGVKIKIEPDQSYDPEDFPEEPVFVPGPSVKQEPRDPDNDYPRSTGGVKRKAASSPAAATSSPAHQWNHNTEDMSRILNNIKPEPGVLTSNAPKKARVDHNRYTF